MKIKNVISITEYQHTRKSWSRGKTFVMPAPFWRPWGLWFRLIAGVQSVPAKPLKRLF